MRFLAIVVLCFAGCGSPEPVRPPADLLLLNGKIVTVDPAIGEAEAVAIRGQRIEAVGSAAEITALQGSETQVIDLDGRLVIPGFIEGHGHYLSYGRAQQIIDLTDARDWEDIVGRVARAVDGVAPGEWVFGRGWHQDKWASVPEPNVDGVPYNDRLNSVAPDNPVYLGHASGHASYANAAALREAGIDQTTPDPAGGTIVRGPDGTATGLLRENAQGLVDRAVAAARAELDPDDLEQEAREQAALAGSAALRHGVTSFHDAGASFATIDFFKTLEAEEALPVRLYVMVRGESNDAMAQNLPDYYMPAAGNDFLTVRSIKRQIDGALGAHGAWLLEPYEDLPESDGLVLETVEEIERTATIAVEHGFQVNTHAIGTRANREVLDLYERVWSERGVTGSDLRWRIEHAQHIHPTDIPRFAELGVIAAVQGVHCTSDGPWIPTRLGEPRTEQTSYRWRDLLDSGARLNNGTDVPVERIDPIASFHASVARTMADGSRFHPSQAMTRFEALKSFTLDNAYSAFEEDIKGSITPGKLADIVVLSDDIMTIADDEIPDAKVDYTIIGGKIRHTREEI